MNNFKLVRVISVPHTGTRTLLHLFGLGFNGKMHAHIKPDGEGWEARMMIGRWPHCVVPLRDPACVWLSWAKSAMCNAKRFIKSWQLLAEYVDKYNMPVIPVDHPLRDTKLHDVQLMWPHVQLPDTYNWPKIGERRVKVKPPETVNLASTYDLLTSIGIDYRNARSVPA